MGVRVGYGTWVGRGRGIPVAHPACSRRVLLTAKRAPEGLQGLEWVVSRSRTSAAPGPPLPAVGPASLSGLAPRAIPASGPITARFHYILLKVSQNGGVSPLFVNKAYHSPCFQNAVQMSPLEILRFPILPAFSHKELMGVF